GCIFWALPAEGDDEGTKILVRGEHAFVILNSFPYNPGHLMVAPFRHVGDLGAIEHAEFAHGHARPRPPPTGLPCGAPPPAQSAHWAPPRPPSSRRSTRASPARPARSRPRWT